jgi:acyl carrier protein
MSNWQRIVAILKSLGVDDARIVPSATAVDLALDSLSLIDFACEVEHAFAVDLDAPEFQKVRTLGELEFEIEKCLALKAHARAA